MGWFSDTKKELTNEYYIIDEDRKMIKKPGIYLDKKRTKGYLWNVTTVKSDAKIYTLAESQRELKKLNDRTRKTLFVIPKNA